MIVIKTTAQDDHPDMLTFQEIICQLSAFWEKKGCILHQGYDLEVGAGTFNPATFLRALGPEPYQTAYVEPSRRPSDGRYGENPNRVQLFHQFQVLIKPSPQRIQEWYLDSLKALHLDLKKHDIRFVHDDWESPTLGASGVGWEVWCDGMEISQFTYFQSIASLALKPISVEITYGLERLALFIQNKNSIFEVLWNDKLTFGAISHRYEVEWSHYHFQEASSHMWMRHFEDFEQEAHMLIAKHLPLPAYDFVMKASHAFNILDARGVISVTERTGYIARIRDLSRLIAAEYISSREALHFPLIVKEKTIKKMGPLSKPPPFNAQKRQDFLLEIGSEPLPAASIPIGCQQLEKEIRKFLNEHQLSFCDLKTFGTPQRLSILVSGLVEGTERKHIEKKGPSVSSAFDPTGQPTAQGKGFLKSLGYTENSLSLIRAGKIAGLRVEHMKEAEYLCASIEQPGQSTFFLLANALEKIILNLEFPKKMRWGNGDATYARPIHWIVALFGTRVIPFQCGNIRSDRLSKGHAQLKPVTCRINHPRNYATILKKHYVLADIEERRQTILKQLHSKVKGEPIEIDRVLSQVLHLTEWPQLTTGSFDPSFLKIPHEVIISEMVEHQKYFPLVNREGKLTNTFVITADNQPSPLIRKGNQKVLAARLTDGTFLYTEDLKTPLAEMNEKLKVMVYQKELGSMFDKVKRIRSIAEQVNHHLALADPKTVARAALLCKADLASLLVGEFPELQGTIGKYYALAHKEPLEVATAIAEHWMPLAENAPLPKTPVGIVLSIADKLDNFISCYQLDLKPTSSSDPYALRRQAIGLIKILIENKCSVDLKNLIETSSSSSIAKDIVTFISARIKSVLQDYGFKKDEIEASSQALSQDPYDQFCKTSALHTFRQSGVAFAQLCEVYRRAKGQLNHSIQTPFNPSIANEKAEIELIQAIYQLEQSWNDQLQKRDYMSAFLLIAKLQSPLAFLFDSVKILSEDPVLRNNRIALLKKVLGYFEQLVDFQNIQEGSSS